VQVLTPIGILDRDKQLGVVRELTDIVAQARRPSPKSDGSRSRQPRTATLDGGWITIAGGCRPAIVDELDVRAVADQQRSVEVAQVVQDPLVDETRALDWPSSGFTSVPSGHEKALLVRAGEAA
jgi:hypothetical protein